MRRNIAPSSASSPAVDGIDNGRPPAASRTEADAKTRFEATVSLGVETLISNGLSRDDAGAILLAEISNGSTPDENEVRAAFGWTPRSVERTGPRAFPRRHNRSVAASSARAVGTLI